MLKDKYYSLSMYVLKTPVVLIRTTQRIIWNLVSNF